MSNESYAATKVISKACAVIDQRKVCAIAPKGQEKRERGRLDAKVNEMAEAVEKYRNPVKTGGQS